ncbi:RNA polymerase sigma factor [Flavobacterium salilacus subsp. salilacus]|uniref:RNA polymerase sigma factor n=1 Tax=Flavobacterium TaxID=237 RepID=UPI0010756E5A|nr:MULTISPECIES: RNA polymerase sigma factor [Flavobacterium]KAF2519712.1 RNA polymerase sigma factor [Flavobacterium salilacus subsp. salilacus]MBE1614399.1 RNA polymerase sigma factor [Flavobacterium sp. SaA2.13]
MKKNSLSGICEEITFSNFFKDHVKSLRNYLFYKFGNEEQADDVTQEAFIKLWQNCADVPPEKAKSFLYTVANNTSLNHIAHQKVVLQYAKRNTHVHTDEQNPEFLMEEEQFKVKLQKAIAGLTEAQRTAFLLHRIDGKKYHEIAEILGISIKAVEKRIHGALVELRKEIENMR